MDYVNIGNQEYSKIICGTNPFYGHSHFSEARKEEYLERFNNEGIKKVINTCINNGINTIETPANERIFEIINDINSSLTQKIKIICTTRIDEVSMVKRHQTKIDMSIQQKCPICIIHSQFIDRGNDRNRIKGIEELIEKIHSNGSLVGISTHSVDLVKMCENNKYNIDVYMFPLNSTGFVYPGYKGNEKPEERVELIQSIDKTFIIMKTLSAGRLPPLEALNFIKKNIKQKDIISIGFGSCREAIETIKIWGEI